MRGWAAHLLLGRACQKIHLPSSPAAIRDINESTDGQSGLTIYTLTTTRTQKNVPRDKLDECMEAHTS